MNFRFQLGIGARFIAAGQKYTVIAIREGCLEVRDSQAQTTLMSILDIISLPDFRAFDDDSASISFPTPAIDLDTWNEALELACHLREAITGSPGEYGDPNPIPPKEAYDPTITSLTKRISLKAGELKASESVMWKWKQLYEDFGVFGLIDQRHIRYHPPFQKIDPRVKLVTLKVLDSIKRDSKLTKIILRERIERQLRRDYSEPIKLPSVATLNRYIKSVAQPLGVFKTAKQRKSADNRPDRTFGHFEANRPGQVVVIDSTVLNNFGLDAVTLKWVQIQLTIAMDLYTRSIIAWRFTRTLPRVDAALLLFDTLVPKQVIPGWHDSTHWMYFGVPDEVALFIDDESKPAGVPAVFPETVLVDHGRVFTSEAFRQACLRLGISIQYARRFSPTDKAIVETTFDFIKENFCARLPGFTGADIASRGVNIENKAIYFVSEFDAMFAEWVATHWQQRDHRGLFLPEVPNLDLSPNDLYKEGISRAGFVYTVPNTTIYYELLPCEWRLVTDTGVPIDGLVYDDIRLTNYRNVPSVYGGVHAGKYPIRFDQRDLEHVYFFDYEATPPQWIALRWRGARDQPMPFNDRAVAWAKNLCIERQLDTRNPRVLEASLRYMLDRWEQGLYGTEKERKAMVMRAEKATETLRDQARINAKMIIPDAEIDLGITFGSNDELDMDAIYTMVEEATAQPIGDQHVSPNDF